MNTSPKQFLRGMKASLPVFIGYICVSIGFGALANTTGLSVFEATLISLTNITSAGQFAGLTVIASGSSLIEMILTQLVINSRYAMMSIAYGQKMGERFGTGIRLFAAFFDTDEIFAIAMNEKGELDKSFVCGLGILPLAGWVGGTYIGAVASSLVPGDIKTALSVALYGMFAAIIVPQIKRYHPMLLPAVLAIAFSCILRWVPFFSFISEGLGIVISTLLTAVICSAVFPNTVREDDEP